MEYSQESSGYGNYGSPAKCPKCNGTKRVKYKDGSIGPCMDCLQKGDMDQHSKNPKDSGVKI